MNGADFEDAVFLLNIRIKMARDTMRLNPPGEVFVDKCMEDLVFIDQVLASLAQKALAEGAQGGMDYAADIEWQFSQLLTEFLLATNAFSARATQRCRDQVAGLREESNERRKIFESLEAPAQADIDETLVSSAELSILLGSA